MTREFDKDYWERHWEQPHGSRPEAATKNAPNPYLIRETSSLVPGTALDAGCGPGGQSVPLHDAVVRARRRP